MKQTKTQREMSNILSKISASKEELLTAWFEVYVLNKEKKDLHREFADRFSLTREEGKMLSYYTIYQSSYLINRNRQERLAVAEVTLQSLQTKDIITAKESLKQQIDFQNKAVDKYFQTYQVKSEE